MPLLPCFLSTHLALCCSLAPCCGGLYSLTLAADPIASRRCYDAVRLSDCQTRRMTRMTRMTLREDPALSYAGQTVTGPNELSRD